MITIIRESPGGTDKYGDPIESTETTHEIPGVIAPRTSDDVEGRGRDGVTIGLTAYSPDPEADVVHTDKVQYRGEIWKIEGEIGVYESPYGPQVDGLTFALTRGEG